MKKTHCYLSQQNPLTYLWTVFACKQCLICTYFSPDSDKINFSMKKAMLWIENSYLCRSNDLPLKMSSWWICFLQTHSFLLHKMLIDGLDLCGLLVDYCDVFVSSHSDGTHSLPKIHWWASHVMLNFLKSVETNFGWPDTKFYQIFIFGLTIYLTF